MYLRIGVQEKEKNTWGSRKRAKRRGWARTDEIENRREEERQEGDEEKWWVWQFTWKYPCEDVYSLHTRAARSRVWAVWHVEGSGRALQVPLLPR